MFDSHNKLNKFYNEQVRLGDEKKLLAEYRDRNITRLKRGLIQLAYPLPTEIRNQGSYAMNTINKHPAKTYDIDVAIVFCSEDLPKSALQARKRVEAAMVEAGGNFAKVPEARTNAVTIWYTEGYHVDFAVYRTYTDFFGNVIYEHAGSDWTRRNPSDITDWFINAVQRLSPKQSFGATVDDGQMRRVVRLLKAFSKSRDAWNLPGGLVISALVAEQYRPDFHRDDMALYKTMESIYHRLKVNTAVQNPVDSSQSLTNKSKYVTQIENFRDQLGNALEKLAVLSQSNCTELDAVKAWEWVFEHKYWIELRGEILLRNATTGALFANSSGKIMTQKPAGPYIQLPSQRFYGAD